MATMGSRHASPALWTVSLIFVTLAVWSQVQRQTPASTPIAFAVWGYAAWVVFDNAFLSPAYSSAGLFNPLFLLTGFGVGRGLDQAERHRVAVGLICGASFLGLWGVWQLMTGEGRGQALFESPNTLATVLNAALLPVAVWLATGERGTSPAIAAAVILLAGLLATFSRAGWGACLAAVVIAGVYLARVNAVRVRGWWIAGLALAVSIVFGAAYWASSGSKANVVFSMVASWNSRLELYSIAVTAASERIWLGIGYLGFNNLLESQRASVPSYEPDRVTYFAHNDYLQTLVELGLPAFVTLALIVILPFVLALRTPRSTAQTRLLIAVLAGIAAIGIHALVDFPLYIPLCLLLLGLLVGTADRVIAANGLSTPWCTARTRMAAISIGAVIASLTAAAAIADAASAYADRQWRQGDGQAAAFGYELARRLQPRDWRYHWYAGQFWSEQAAQSGSVDAARLCEGAFAAASAANPREPRPIFGRIAAHMRFAQLLAAPADARTLRAWSDRALALAPLNPAIRTEHAAVAAQLARREGARR